MAQLLNKCPICGGVLEYHAFQQYVLVSTLKKNGSLSAKSRRREVGSMECGYLSCQNEDFVTDCDFESEDYPHIRIWQQGDHFYFENEQDEE